ncbi:MAG: rhodanese-like domain-containing protein [Spirochaeta sp.]
MYATIDRETLKHKLDSGEDIRLLEVLSEDEFKRLHIAGAEHLNFKRVIQEAGERFEKDDTIVVYCANKSCTASPTAARKLDSAGFTNVYDYEEGKQDWVDAGYPVEGEEA